MSRNEKYNKLSDEDLMILLANGSENALAEIYHRYKKMLFGYFHKMLWQNTEKAEDFLHDLFLKIVDKSSSFRYGNSFKSWIFSIAANMCKNEFRSRRIRFDFLQKNKTDIEPIEEAEIELNSDFKQFNIELEKELFKFNHSTRSVFYLRYFSELSISEISEIMKIPEGTVKSRLFNLNKKLAKSLAHYNPKSEAKTVESSNFKILQN